MADKNYIYAVARIRTKELSLLNESYLEQLVGAKTYKECIQLLVDKGWGEGEDNSAEGMLAAERKKTWALIADLVKDMSVFDVFLYANDYHNLKAAIKAVCTNSKRDDIYINQGTIEPAVILKAIEERHFDLLPERMRAVAEEGFNSLLHTRDGQLLDVLIDKAALEAILEAGYATKNPILSLYGELTVVTADLKIAVRAAKTGKDAAFLEKALAPCKTLDIRRLKDAALDGFDAICDYMQMTKYADGVEELKKSMSAFERWGDNLIIRAIKPEIHHPFTIGPLAAYILARENEIKTVRIVLSGKLNDLPEESVRERVREMYV
ncbi:V-type ATPase subunit [Lachnospiraceae bacterium C1.1]|nr:V-type ATPase subunit [Lachnospiraceae bacterium C1.1]